MDGRSVASFPWWPIVAFVVAGAVALALAVLPLVRRSRQARQRDEAERLARIADAEHEGARTRHEGGA